jgi:hypothetical protein
MKNQQIDLEGNTIFKPLTWRQKQSLIALYWRNKNYGSATFSDVVGDTGVAFATLAGHLKALGTKGLLYCRTDPRNMSFNEKLEITDQGNHVAEKSLDQLNASINDTIGTIFTKLKTEYEDAPISPSTGYNLNNRSNFSKAYTNLIKNKNLTEPVITSIALYTELDSQLNLLRTSDNDTYLSLSKSKLNIEIRSGRLSSIAIPIMLRGQIPQHELMSILGNSWSWLNTVDHRSVTRYMNEATSLGVISERGGMITSPKPSATDAMSWLATKTGDTFLNTMNIAPKAALLAFREVFNYPTEEELLSPNITDNLPWAREIFDNIDKDVYRHYMNEAINILVEKANVVENVEGRLIPRTVMRSIKDGSGIKESFKTILKFSQTEKNSSATILLSITANPGITIDELHRKIKPTLNIKIEDLEMGITNLANKGLIHIARSSISKGGSIKLFTFAHIPFIEPQSKDVGGFDEANAVFKGIEPWVLSSLKDFFPSNEEKKDLGVILSNLQKKKEIAFDDIDTEYSKNMSRKIGAWSYTLKPFIQQDSSFSTISMSDTRISSMILDILQYSLLTTNDALGQYASAISSIVGRDRSFVKTLEDDAVLLKTELMNKKTK